MARRSRQRFWYAFFALTFLGFVWPGVTFANRIEPFVFGLPFLFFWFVALISLQFAALVVMYLTEPDE